MPRLRPISRRAPLLTALVALALLTTGCGQNGPIGRSAAAEVDGKAITAQAVQDTVDAQRSFFEISGTSAEKQRADAEAAGQAVMSAQELAANIDSQITGMSGQGSETIATAAAADALSSIINTQLLAVALDEAGGELTEQQRGAARTAVEADVQKLGLTTDQISPTLLDAEIERAALRSALEATAPPEIANAPTTSDEEYTEQLRQLYQSQRDQFAKLCGRVIQTADAAAGQEARTRIEAGEDFTAVATDLSVDGGADAASGEPACAPTGQLASLFGPDAETAEAGDLVGPSEAAEGSFLLFQVDSAETASFEEVRPTLEEANPNTAGQQEADAALADYVGAALTKAAAETDVVVDPRYGTWDPQNLVVAPPADPAAGQAPAPLGGEPVPGGPDAVPVDGASAGPGGP